MDRDKEYYVISLKWSTGDNVCFWRPNSSGYTEYPDEAGIYTEAQIEQHQDYYNDGEDTLAVEKSQLKELFTSHTIVKWNSTSIKSLKEAIKNKPMEVGA